MKNNISTIRNYILLRLRGLVYYFFYEFRFFPYVKIYSLINASPIVSLFIGGVTYKMKLDLKDMGLSWDIFICRVREYPNVLYFKKFLKKNGQRIDTIVDIGANIGYYVLYENAIFKQTLKKKVSIYAVEPVFESLVLLEDNVALNNASNTTVVQAAVGEKDGTANIIVQTHRNLSQIEEIGSYKTLPSSLKRRVKMYSLKGLFSQYKIPHKNILFRWDIEGYEYNLIKGNQEILRQLKNVHIIMEFHSFFLLEKKTVELLNLLKDLGFRLEYVVSCYPPYFLKMPTILRKMLVKTWLWEKNGSNLGILSEFKSIDDLIREFHNKKSALYTYPNLHFYLVKGD